MKNVTKAFIFALAFPLSISVAFAQGNGLNKMQGGMNGKQKQGMMRIYKELDLSSSQQQQIKAIFKNTKMNRLKMSDDDRASMRAEWQTLMRADSFDEAKAKTLIMKKQSHMLVNGVAKAKTRFDAYQVLDSEQKAKFDAILESKPRRKPKN